MFAFPAPKVGVALVGAHQFGGEERGFIASGTGADFDEGVSVLVRIGGEQGVLEVVGEGGDGGFKAGDFLGCHGGKLGIVGFDELLVVGELAFGGLEVFPEIEGLFEFPVLAEDFGGAFRIGKKIGIAYRIFQFGEAFTAFGDERGVIHGRGVKAEKLKR